ncbi:hypothetical protein NUBL21985_50360 [Klebsiella pneumoniae]|nr:hypothetical protein NUBL21985_50360 [Klebsiella pneumoniae]GKM37041.1 hypothetical protein NUBL21996_52650 [Klebsiella pneumoniae]
MRSNGPEGGGQDARHKLPGIKQVKSPSCRMGFLRFCRPASVPVCLSGGAALTGATDPTRGYVPVAGQGAQHRLYCFAK